MILTRRTLLKAVAAAATASAQAAEPDFSFIVAPDTQFLAEECKPSFTAVMQWVVNNQALSVGGGPLNIKAVIGVGDCLNQLQAGQYTAAANAYGVLDSNGFPYITPPGNHDYEGNNSALTRNSMGTHFLDGGTFSPSVRSGKSVWGSSLPGSGGFAYWGGAFDTTGSNTYIRLAVGSRKFLIIALEYAPRSAVLIWARGLHDVYTDHEVIITTHNYMNDMGEQCPRGTGTTHNIYGPDAEDPGDNSMKSAPTSNCGTEMWAGSAPAPTWSGFTTWPRLRMIVCGHWIYKATDTDGAFAPWYWQRIPVSNDFGKPVQQIFCNWQEKDDITNGHVFGETVPNWCPSGANPDGTSDTAHLFILKFRPGTGTIEAYALSTNSGKWMGAAGSSPVSSPVQLFSIAMPDLLEVSSSVRGGRGLGSAGSIQ